MDFPWEGCQVIFVVHLNISACLKKYQCLGHARKKAHFIALGQCQDVF